MLLASESKAPEDAFASVIAPDGRARRAKLPTTSTATDANGFTEPTENS